MRVCEVYTSVQGEGPNTGKPITFLRFGGCNLRCPGWGEGTLPDGTVVPGCDTTFAVYPEWYDTWESKGVQDILKTIPETPRHVCLTGGEPLIQRTKDLNDLVFRLLEMGFKIDLFTNGTQLLGNYVWTALSQVTVVMDWKLPGSGEGSSFNVNNLIQLGSKDAIKFVVKDRHDFDIALKHIEWGNGTALLNGVDTPEIWFGPVWDVMDPKTLVEWMEEVPGARLNLQTHKYIWDPNERKV